MKKYRKLYTFLLAGVFCLCSFLYITYSFHFNLSFNWGTPVFIGLFLSYHLIISFWFDINTNSAWLRFIKYLLIVVVFVALYVGLNIARSKYFDHELKKNGIKVDARIIGYKSSSTRWSRDIYALFVYDYNGSNYTQQIINDSDFFRINDLLQIICSRHDPEIFRIVSVKHQYDKTLYLFK